MGALQANLFAQREMVYRPACFLSLDFQELFG